jgi:hypothetical protein
VNELDRIGIVKHFDFELLLEGSDQVILHMVIVWEIVFFTHIDDLESC